MAQPTRRACLDCQGSTCRRSGGGRADPGSSAWNAGSTTATPVPVQTYYPANVCSINGWPGANGPGSADVNGNTVTIVVPLKAIGLDAGTPIVVKGANGSRNIVKRTVGQIFDYPGVNFGNTTPGNYFDLGHYTRFADEIVGRLDTLA